MSELPKSLSETGDEPTSRRVLAILWAIGAAMFGLGFVASAGLFTIDEIIYVAGSQAILNNATFVVENGWSQFRSPDLHLQLLVAGPAGLVPQYPAGHALLGAPFIAIFGDRGLMMMNVLAGAGLLFTTFALSRRLFADSASALLAVAMLCGATFWLEYVYAVWPHVVSMLCVTLAFLWAIDCLESRRGHDWKAMAAGAAVGVGFLVRTDSIIIIAIIGFVAILFAERPFRLLIFFGLGMLPFVALVSGLNYVKFGTFNPLSYGRTGGGTSLASHIMPIAGLAALSVALLAWRFLEWRPGKKVYAAGVALLVLAVIFSETIQNLAVNYLTGTWALIGDATTISEDRSGMNPVDSGLLSFWGLWKKALGQSMPWIGLLLLCFHLPADARTRRSWIIVLVSIAIWTLPFCLQAWHGGMGSNMRYFLPIIPALCVLAAKVLFDFARGFANPQRILAVGALTGVVVLILWTTNHPTGIGGAQQIVSTYLFVAVAVLSLLAGLKWRAQGQVRTICLGAIGAGLAASTLFMTLDLVKSQTTRADDYSLSLELAALPDNALVYAPTRFLELWAFQPGHIAALPRDSDGSFDFDLIEQALDADYRVLIWPSYANAALQDYFATRLAPSGVTYPDGEFLEIHPAMEWIEPR